MTSVKFSLYNHKLPFASTSCTLTHLVPLDKLTCRLRSRAVMDVMNGTDLPVIDLSVFSLENVDQNQLEKVLDKLRHACREVGFFQVVNHGVDPTLIKSVEGRAREVFALPAEVKSRAIIPILHTGYGPPLIDDVQKDSLPENISFPSDLWFPNSVENISAKLWPEGNPEFCEEINAYKAQVGELSHRILKLLVWSLGVDISSPSASEVFERSFGNVRINYYKDFGKEMVSKAHTDICFFTILYQDDVGGLQIRNKEGKWMDANPLAGSFVINIADVLLMWSNGRYRSAEHRVVYGMSNRDRLSIAYFFDLPYEFEIQCPKETIDEDNPKRFEVVTEGDVVEHYKKIGPSMATTEYFKIGVV